MEENTADVDRFVRNEAILTTTLGARTARRGSSSSGGGGGRGGAGANHDNADGSAISMVDRQHLSSVLEQVS